MKRKIAYLILGATLASVPLTFTTGCAVTQGRESAKEYAKDRELVTRVKTDLYRDPIVKGTQIEVNALRGTVQLSGFADSEEARQRAERIASSTPGVLQVHNNVSAADRQDLQVTAVASYSFPDAGRSFPPAW